MRKLSGKFVREVILIKAGVMSLYSTTDYSTSQRTFNSLKIAYVKPYMEYSMTVVRFKISIHIMTHIFIWFQTISLTTFGHFPHPPSHIAVSLWWPEQRTDRAIISRVTNWLLMGIYVQWSDLQLTKAKILLTWDYEIILTNGGLVCNDLFPSSKTRLAAALIICCGFKKQV